MKAPSRAFPARLLLGVSFIITASQLAGEDLIPSSLPKEKQEKLIKFLNKIKQGEKGSFIPANAKLKPWSSQIAIDYPPATGHRVRVGASAQNYYDRKGPPPQGPYRPGGDIHLHVGCWMLDPDLGDPTGRIPGGAAENVVQLVRRVQETPGSGNGLFRLEVIPFPGDSGQSGPAVSGSAMWNPEQFTLLRIQSMVRHNGSGFPHPTAYDLIPLRNGSCRFFPSPRYDYANRDFWVTAADPSFNQYREVPDYVRLRSGAIDHTPVRVWHNSPLLHVPRGEDFGPDGVSRSEGSALLSWTGFLLKPRDLFDGTPLLPK